MEVGGAAKAMAVQATHKTSTLGSLRECDKQIAAFNALIRNKNTDLLELQESVTSLDGSNAELLTLQPSLQDRVLGMTQNIADSDKTCLRIKNKLPYLSRRSILDNISRLEVQLRSHNYRPREEERVLREISKLRNSLPLLEQYRTVLQQNRQCRSDRVRLVALRNANYEQLQQQHSRLHTCSHQLALGTEERAHLSQALHEVEDRKEGLLQVAKAKLWKRQQRKQSSGCPVTPEQQPQLQPPQPLSGAPKQLKCVERNEYATELVVCHMLLRYTKSLAPQLLPTTESLLLEDIIDYPNIFDESGSDPAKLVSVTRGVDDLTVSRRVATPQGKQEASWLSSMSLEERLHGAAADDQLLHLQPLASRNSVDCGKFYSKPKDDLQGMLASKTKSKKKKKKRKVVKSSKKEIGHPPDVVANYLELGLTVPRTVGDIPDTIKAVQQKINYFDMLNEQAYFDKVIAMKIQGVSNSDMKNSSLSKQLNVKFPSDVRKDVLDVRRTGNSKVLPQYIESRNSSGTNYNLENYSQDKTSLELNFSPRASITDSISYSDMAKRNLKKHSKDTSELRRDRPEPGPHLALGSGVESPANTKGLTSGIVASDASLLTCVADQRASVTSNSASETFDAVVGTRQSLSAAVDASKVHDDVTSDRESGVGEEEDEVYEEDSYSKDRCGEMSSALVVQGETDSFVQSFDIFSGSIRMRDSLAAPTNTATVGRVSDCGKSIGSLSNRSVTSSVATVTESDPTSSTDSNKSTSSGCSSSYNSSNTYSSTLQQVQPNSKLYSAAAVNNVSNNVKKSSISTLGSTAKQELSIDKRVCGAMVPISKSFGNVDGSRKCKSITESSSPNVSKQQTSSITTSGSPSTAGSRRVCRQKEVSSLPSNVSDESTVKSNESKNARTRSDAASKTAVTIEPSGFCAESPSAHSKDVVPPQPCAVISYADMAKRNLR